MVQCVFYGGREVHPCTSLLWFTINSEWLDAADQQSCEDNYSYSYSSPRTALQLNYTQYQSYIYYHTAPIRKMRIIFVIVLVLGLGFGLPVEQRRADGVVDEPDASPRFRRRVGNLNITSTLEQYVRDLYEEYASGSEYGADKPTDVWCFADKGELSFLLCSFFSFILPFNGSKCIMVCIPPSQMSPKNISDQNQRGMQSVKHTHSTSSSGVQWPVR